MLINAPTTSAPHIVFAGGVTGGHLFPGLAVAEQILDAQPAARFTFVGPGRAFDRDHVQRAGFDYVAVASPRAPRSIADVAPFGLRMWRGYREAAQFLLRGGVSAVVGLGGFASLPASIGALRSGLPLLLLEQNAIVGRANRWLSRRANALCLSFPRTRFAPRGAEIPLGGRVLLTGTPIRVAFRHAQPIDSGQPVLLVLGGSGGARSLNRSVPIALGRLRHELEGWQVVHQTGHADAAETAAAYQKAGIAARVVPFCDDMAPLLGRTALAICRAGGSTVAELAALRVPAILVPWSGARDDHQRANAMATASAGAAVIVAQDAAEPAALGERLAVVLQGLLADPQRRAEIATAAGISAKPRAAQLVADLLLGLVEKRRCQRRHASLDCPASPLSIDTLAA